MSKRIRIRDLSLSQRISHEIDLQLIKEWRKDLPPPEKIKMEISTHNCMFGPVLIGTKNDFLYSVELGESVDECHRNFFNRWKSERIVSEPRTNNNLVKLVLESIDSGIVDPNIKIISLGTFFQMEVWEAIRTIPVGQTASYQTIANQIERPNSVRAIGTACGANPIAILIPCHRIIKSNGELGDYKWGIELKKQLLQKERNE